MEITYIYCKKFTRGLYGISIQSKCGHEFRAQVTRKELDSKGLINILYSLAEGAGEELGKRHDDSVAKDERMLYAAADIMWDKKERESGM